MDSDQQLATLPQSRVRDTGGRDRGVLDRVAERPNDLTVAICGIVFRIDRYAARREATREPLAAFLEPDGNASA
jgi:hypothetical protein